MLLLPLWTLALLAQTAEPQLRDSVRRNPRAFESNHALGEFLLQSGQAKGAVPFLETARAAQPTHPANTHDLALAYIQTGAPAKAKPLIDALTAAGVSSPNLEGHYWRAMGDPQAAALAFQRAAETDPTEDHLFDLADHLLAHRGFHDGRKILLWSVERYPKSPRLRVALGVAEYSLGNYDKAVETLCTAVDLDPADPRPLTFLGEMIDVSPALGEELARRLKAMSEKYPKNAQAQYFYAMSLLASPAAVAEKEKAEALLKSATTLDPRDYRPHLALGKMYEASNRLPEAVQAFRAALQRDPNVETSHYRLAQVYLRQKRSDLAAPHLAAYRKLHDAKK
jgi:tetratricopeptide (TPR) repeat protein